MCGFEQALGNVMAPIQISISIDPDAFMPPPAPPTQTSLCDRGHTYPNLSDSDGCGFEDVVKNMLCSLGPAYPLDADKAETVSEDKPEQDDKENKKWQKE
jgi:hypothetical protein